MLAYRLTNKALEDLRSIARYTEKNWGWEQRNKYLSKLDASIQMLLHEPQLGRACDEIRKGYRQTPCGPPPHFLSSNQFTHRNYSHLTWKHGCWSSPAILNKQSPTESGKNRGSYAVVSIFPLVGQMPATYAGRRLEVFQRWISANDSINLPRFFSLSLCDAIIGVGIEFGHFTTILV